MTRARGKPGPDPDPSDELLLARRERVGQLHLQGKSQREIAEELGVSQPTVHRDLEVLSVQWQERAVAMLGERKSTLLAEVQNLKATHWDAWNRSRADAVTETYEEQDWSLDTQSAQGTVTIDGARHKVELSGSLPAKRGKATQKIEHPVGDPRFLEGVLKAIETEAKILGLPLSGQVAAQVNQHLAVQVNLGMTVLPTSAGRPVDVGVDAGVYTEAYNQIQEAAAPPLPIGGSKEMEMRLTEVLDKAPPGVRSALLDRWMAITEEMLMLDADLQRVANSIVEGEAQAQAQALALPAPAPLEDEDEEEE